MALGIAQSFFWSLGREKQGMQKATQDKNVIQISTPAGKDALYLTRFVAQEPL